MDGVVERLLSLGYVATEDDQWMIDFTTQKVSHAIENRCNIFKIPEGLKEITIDRICGEFLYLKQQSGGLEQFEAVLKQVSAGDTTVTFEQTQSPESQFALLLAYLMDAGEKEITCYRTLKW